MVTVMGPACSEYAEEVLAVIFHRSQTPEPIDGVLLQLDREEKDEVKNFYGTDKTRFIPEFAPLR